MPRSTSRRCGCSCTRSGQGLVDLCGRCRSTVAACRSGGRSMGWRWTHSDGAHHCATRLFTRSLDAVGLGPPRECDHPITRRQPECTRSHSPLPLGHPSRFLHDSYGHKYLSRYLGHDIYTTHVFCKCYRRRCYSPFATDDSQLYPTFSKPLVCRQGHRRRYAQGYEGHGRGEGV